MRHYCRHPLFYIQLLTCPPKFMEWTIAEFDDPRRITAAVRGLFTIIECRIGIAELAARKDPFTPVLFDHRELDFRRTTTFPHRRFRQRARCY